MNKSILKNNYFTLEASLFLMGLFSTLAIFRVCNRGVVWFLGIIVAFLVVYKHKKISLKIIDWNFILFLGSLLFTVRFCFFSTISTIMIFIVANLMQNNTKRELNIFIFGLKCSCIVSVIWCLIQYVSFNIFHLNINDLIFIEKLHLVENASFGENLTGMAWHPVNLVPVLLLCVLFFDHWLMWGICFFISVNASSSTTMIALFLALILLKGRYIIRKNGLPVSMPARKLLFIFLSLIAVSVALYFLFPSISDEAKRLISRLSGAGTEDESTYLHKRYYTSIYYVFSHSSIYEIMFGYGYHQSGLVFAKFFNQFSGLSSWSVESDPMDYLYGNGVIGFTLFYCFLVNNMLRSRNKEYKLFCFYLIVIVCGITYNIQFEWVMQLELIFEVLRKKNIVVFGNSDNKAYVYSNKLEIKRIINLIKKGHTIRLIQQEDIK